MNDEILFAIRYTSAVSDASQRFSNEARASGGFLGLNTPTADFIAEYYDGQDPRGDFVISEPDDDSRQYNVKFDDGQNSGIDLPVLRYADILLMYAEILNEESTTGFLAAQDVLNQVRFRAFGDEADNVSVASQVEMRDAIINERRIELSFENQRWFDLLRYLDLGYLDIFETMNAHFVVAGESFTMGPDQLVYPVPQREVDVSLGQLAQVD